MEGRTSIQVSSKLRHDLEKRKTHPRQSYEEVIRAHLQGGPSMDRARLPPRARDALEEALAGLRRLYGQRIRRLVLYGSYARGEARPDSDIDLLVVLAGEVDRGREIDRIVEITYDILLERGIHVSVLPMSDADFVSQTTPLLVNVRREGIPL